MTETRVNNHADMMGHAWTVTLLMQRSKCRGLDQNKKKPQGHGFQPGLKPLPCNSQFNLKKIVSEVGLKSHSL